MRSATGVIAGASQRRWRPTLSDRDADPRFYPLRSNDVHLTIGGDYVRATGSLHQPQTGTLVTNVDIEHNSPTDSGHALLDVPGVAFGPNLQPDQLTRLTEGVVALVNGTVRGQGQINWSSARGSYLDWRFLDRRTWTSPRHSDR